MKRIVTINTDAGFYPREKIGSYAYWIKADGLFIRGSGVFKEKLNNALEAEMKSIINAIHILDKSNYTYIRKIIINRDNIYTQSKKKGNQLERMLYQRVKKLMKKCGHPFTITSFLEFRHVKAHSDKDDKRSWVNEWCDAQCKRELREYKQKHFPYIKEEKNEQAEGIQ